MSLAAVHHDVLVNEFILHLLLRLACDEHIV